MVAAVALAVPRHLSCVGLGICLTKRRVRQQLDRPWFVLAVFQRASEGGDAFEGLLV
jgi:hypothetical protein